MNKDGSLKKRWSQDGWIGSNTSDEYQSIIKNIDGIVKLSNGITTKQELKTSITKLGSPLSSITFVSKQGHEFECTNEPKVEYVPEVRVDK